VQADLDPDSLRRLRDYLRELRDFLELQCQQRRAESVRVAGGGQQ
jgi:hypothetical protein